MIDQIEFQEVEEAARRLGPVAYIGTVTPSGKPHVSPVYPAFRDEAIWVAVDLHYQKVRNVEANPAVQFHYQVLESTGLETLIISGTAAVVVGSDVRKRLWEGVFGYDLNSVAPDGPETANEIGFLRVIADRAVLAGRMGGAPHRRWTKSTDDNA